MHKEVSATLNKARVICRFFLTQKLEIMLFTKDLRIGILVLDTLRNKHIELNINKLKELSISQKVFFDRYKGIELYEDFLIISNFSKGFETNQTAEYKLISDKRFEIVFLKKQNLYTFFWNNKRVKSIKYVHQLQNLLTEIFF